MCSTAEHVVGRPPSLPRARPRRARCRPVPACSSRPPCPAQPRQLHVGDHGDQDRATEDDGSGLALIPIRLKPSAGSASTSAPRNAPTIVPEPPASAVPPMTAPAIGVEHRRVAAVARVDGVRPERLHEPGQRPHEAGDHEVAVLDPGDVDAGLAGAEDVAADRDRVQAPPGPAEHHLEDRDQDDRPGDLGPGPGARASAPMPRRRWPGCSRGRRARWSA